MIPALVTRLANTVTITVKRKSELQLNLGVIMPVKELLWVLGKIERCKTYAMSS